MAFTVKRTKDAQEGADKYEQQTAQAGPALVAGYKSPKRDPKAAMVAAAPRWKQAVQDAIAKDRFKAGAQAFNVDEAIATMEQIGAAQYVAGTGARKPKVLRKLTKIIAAQRIILTHADTMPTATLAERLAKANYIATEMNKLKGTFN